MQIVTLTTDFGLTGYYAAVLKGTILCQNQALNIVDISHNINTYDIVQAAYIFKNAWHNFPKGSIHLISVGESLNQNNQQILFETAGHYFIGPDNGVFSLIFPELNTSLYALATSKLKATENYASIINQISKGTELAKIGEKVDQIVKRISLQAVISTSQIRGSVIYIDNYENAILNIERNLFEQVGRSRPFSLFFKRNEPITKLSENYSDVAIGETLCLFNSANYLEIAINLGKASSLLGLNIEDNIQIDFHN